MADFFGAVLDGIRDIDSVDKFFSNGLAGVGKYLSGDGKSEEQGRTKWNEGFYGHTNDEVRYSPRGDDTRPAPSEDYEKNKREWFERLHRFSGLDSTNTEVKL